MNRVEYDKEYNRLSSQLSKQKEEVESLKELVRLNGRIELLEKQTTAIDQELESRLKLLNEELRAVEALKQEYENYRKINHDDSELARKAEHINESVESLESRFAQLQRENDELEKLLLRQDELEKEWLEKAKLLGISKP